MSYNNTQQMTTKLQAFFLNLCVCVYPRHTSFYSKNFNLHISLYIITPLLTALRHTCKIAALHLQTTSFRHKCGDCGIQIWITDGVRTVLFSAVCRLVLGTHQGFHSVYIWSPLPAGITTIL